MRIEQNVITTGAIVGPSNGVQPDVIHAVGPGSYRIAPNSIVSEWATGAGIRVQGNGGFSEARAVVLDNDVIMAAPEGTIFGNNSVGIEIRGAAQGNMVMKNRIRGRARAGLALVVDRGTPAKNTFAANDLEGFQPSFADVFVDTGVTDTYVVQGRATIADQGTGTLGAPLSSRIARR